MNRLRSRQQHTPAPSPTPSPALIPAFTPNHTFTRTERKASLNPNRPALLDLTSNMPASQQKRAISRQSSAELGRGGSRQSSSKITASKWLDSDKEMMEFIMSLKARKGNPTASQCHNRKGTEGFEVE